MLSCSNEVVGERSYTKIIKAELAELCQLQEKIELGSKIFLVKLERKDGVENYFIRENN
jgi:hypothetical protein